MNSDPIDMSATSDIPRRGRTSTVEHRCLGAPLELGTWVKLASGEIGTIDRIISVPNGGYLYDVIVGRCWRHDIDATHVFTI
jgi:hypothetical protein